MDIKKYSAKPLLLIFALSSLCFSLKRKVNIVFIGDSITQGEKQSVAPPFFAAAFLNEQLGPGRLKVSNQGVSGCTTVDFLPSTSTYFPKVEKAADSFYREKDASLIFSIMLGTNDSAIDGPLGSPVSTASYSDNMKTIIDKLLNDYPGSEVIIHHPLWYSPNTYNKSKYLQEGLTRLQTYFAAIDALVKDYSQAKPGQVFTGDKEGFDYFKENHQAQMIPENGQQGTFYLHPNVAGAKKLAQFWSKAIVKIIESH